MVKIRATLMIFGEHFSPARFSAGGSVRLQNAEEPGDMINCGPSKGKLATTGYAEIAVVNRAGDWESFSSLLSVAEGCIDKLREAGATEFQIFCSLYHDGQCNFDFSAEDLAKLAALKVDMPISVYGPEFFEEA